MIMQLKKRAADNFGHNVCLKTIRDTFFPKICGLQSRGERDQTRGKVLKHVPEKACNVLTGIYIFLKPEI